MNTRTVFTFFATMVIGGAFLAGSANAIGKADEKTPINDAWLTAKTKIALFADARGHGKRDRRGKRTRFGGDPWEGGFQCGQVWQVPGVKSVKNDLTVKEKA